MLVPTAALASEEDAAIVKLQSVSPEDVMNGSVIAETFGEVEIDVPTEPTLANL